jgi:hypothetical protein
LLWSRLLMAVITRGRSTATSYPTLASAAPDRLYGESTDAQGYAQLQVVTSAEVRVVVQYFGMVWDVPRSRGGGGQAAFTLLLEPVGSRWARSPRRVQEAANENDLPEMGDAAAMSATRQPSPKVGGGGGGDDPGLPWIHAVPVGRRVFWVPSGFPLDVW